MSRAIEADQEHKIVTAMRRALTSANDVLQIITAVSKKHEHAMYDEHIGLHGYFTEAIDVLRYGNRIARWSMQERFDDILSDETAELSQQLKNRLHDLLSVRTIRGMFLEWFVRLQPRAQRSIVRINAPFKAELLRALWARGHYETRARLLVS